jgi:PAS domain S-box-containing protein
MPRLDGIGLLRALRDDPDTRDIPIILLSDPANEGSRFDALKAGAADYLLKPLSAPDLLVRVDARLEIARLRRKLLDLERKSTTPTIEDAETVFARKSNRLRRARNSLQRELSSRTEEVSQLNQELIADRQTLLSLKDELAAELKSMNELHELSTRLLGHTEIEPLLKEVLEASMALLNADFGNVQLYDPKSHALKIVAQRGFEQDFLDYFDNVQEGTGSCGAALERRERIIVEDVLTDPVFAPHLPIVNAAGYRAVQSTPLTGRGGEMLGMISTHFRQPHRPSERDLRFVDLYARQAADMIERKRAEDELSRANAKIMEILESITDGFSAWDRNWRYIYANERSAQLLGKPREQLIGRSVWDLFPEAVGTEAYHKCQQAMAERLSVHFEACFDNRWYENYVYPTKEGLSVYWREITDRKRAEEALRASEERFRRYFELGLIGMAMTSPSKGILEVNDELCRILGYERDELLQKTWAEMTHPDDLAVDIAQFNRVLAGEIDGYSLDKRWIRKDGAIIDSIMSAQCMRRADGSVDYFVGLLLDTTERKRAEERLRRSEAYLAEAQRLSYTGSWAWNASTGEIFSSQELLRIFGLEAGPSTPTHETFLMLLHPEDRHRIVDAFDEAAHNRIDYEAEYRIVRPDGSIRHIHNLAHPVLNESGVLVEYIGTAIDITERKQAEESVRQAYEQVDRILDSISDNFFGLSSDGRFTYFNKHAAKQMQILGKDPAHLIGKVAWDEFPDMPNKENVQRVLTERVPITDELYYAPLGEWVENHMYPSPDGGLVTFQRYITERKRTEEALRRSEAFLAEGQKISHTGSWTVSFPSEAVFWSKETFRIYGVEPDTTKLSQENVFQLIHPEDRQFVKGTFERAVRDQSDFAVEHRAILADGSLKHLYALGHPIINDSGELVEYVGTVVDISERKGAEESLQRAYAELAHATRVTTMGELAASIAHEINQPLGAIVNNGNVAIRIATAENTSHDKLVEVLSDIVADANRTSAIIAHIRAVMKNYAPEKTSLQLKDVVEAVLALVQRELDERRVQVRTELPEDLPSVSGDRIQLQQVLLNLVMNGIEAMSDVDEARRILTIGGRRDDLAGQPAVVIAVRDFGNGFSPEDNERLFDAFYTTKPTGMGMGLRISRSIVEMHGGRLWATPNEGQGATFFCALPIAN